MFGELVGGTQFLRREAAELAAPFEFRLAAVHDRGERGEGEFAVLQAGRRGFADDRCRRVAHRGLGTAAQFARRRERPTVGHAREVAGASAATAAREGACAAASPGAAECAKAIPLGAGARKALRSRRTGATEVGGGGGMRAAPRGVSGEGVVHAARGLAGMRGAGRRVECDFARVRGTGTGAHDRHPYSSCDGRRQGGAGGLRPSAVVATTLSSSNGHCVPPVAGRFTLPAIPAAYVRPRKIIRANSALVQWFGAAEPTLCAGSSASGGGAEVIVIVLPEPDELVDRRPDFEQRLDRRGGLAGLN